MEGHRRSEAILGLGMLAAAAFYRPLIFWSDNAWDLSSPIKPLMYGFALFLVGVSVYFVLVRTVAPPIGAAMTSGLVLLVLVHWNRLSLSTRCCGSDSRSQLAWD